MEFVLMGITAMAVILGMILGAVIVLAGIRVGNEK